MRSYTLESFGKPLAQVLRETPQPQGREVLLEVQGCGVCHTDVHLHDGYFSLGGSDKLDMTRALRLPRVLGHEMAGIVRALGPQAQSHAAAQAHGQAQAQAHAQSVAVGDACVVYPWLGCGTCNLCQGGDEHLCATPQVLGVQRDGGFASHVLVPDARYVLPIGPLAPEQAAILACSGLTAYSALKKLPGLGAQDRLLIVGAGGVGLSGVRLARELYPQTAITVAEIDPAKWDLARDAGAAEVINPAEEGAVKALLKSTGGGVAAAVDFVGAGSSFAFALGALRKAGRLVCVGLYGGAAPVVPALLSLRAVSITGSYVGSLTELQELLALARQGRLPPAVLNVAPLDEASQALEALRAGRVLGRTVLKP